MKWLASAKTKKKPVDAKSLERTKLTQASFKLESVTISTVQLIKIRKLFQKIGVPCQPNEELNKAASLLAKLRQQVDSAGGFGVLRASETSALRAKSRISE